MIIYKYPVPPMVGSFTHALPPGHFSVVHVGLQDGSPYMWIRLDDSKPTKPVPFRVFGTGEPVPEYYVWACVGTFVIDAAAFESRFVGHVHVDYESVSGDSL